METRPGTTIFKIRSSCLNKIKKFTNSSLDFTIFHCVSNSKKIYSFTELGSNEFECLQSPFVWNKEHFQGSSTSISTKFFAYVEITLVHWLLYYFHGKKLCPKAFQTIVQCLKKCFEDLLQRCKVKENFLDLNLLLYHKQDQIGNLPALYLLNNSFNYPLNS